MPDCGNTALVKFVSTACSSCASVRRDAYIICKGKKSLCTKIWKYVPMNKNTRQKNDTRQKQLHHWVHQTIQRNNVLLKWCMLSFTIQYSHIFRECLPHVLCGAREDWVPLCGYAVCIVSMILHTATFLVMLAAPIQMKGSHCRFGVWSILTLVFFCLFRVRATRLYFSMEHTINNY